MQLAETVGSVVLVAVIVVVPEVVLGVTVPALTVATEVLLEVQTTSGVAPGESPVTVAVNEPVEPLLVKVKEATFKVTVMG